MSKKVKHLIETLRNKVLNDEGHAYGTETIRNMVENLKKLQWDQIFHAVFSPASWSQANRIFVISLIASTSYFTGKTIGVAIQGKPGASKIRGAVPMPPPPPTVGTDRLDYIEEIEDANLFNAVVDSKDAKERPQLKKKIDEDKVCDSASRKSSLPLQLSNTIVLQNLKKSIASIQIRSGQLENFRQGDNIKGTAQITKIERLRIIVKNLNTGECEYIVNESQQDQKSIAKEKLTILSPQAGKKLLESQATDGIKNEGNNFTIKKNFRDNMLKDMGNVLTQARAIQIKNPDGSLSFKMTEVLPGSIYSKLNIQNDDIITALNGKKIENLNDIMSLFGRIKDVDKLQITVKRDGTEQNMDYQFE